MALFGGQRDISLFRNMNREVLRRWIDISIDWYKINLGSTEVDIYGESDSRTYYMPIRIHCWIERNDQEFVTDEMGTDVNQQLIFSFLRDDLVDIGTVPDVGDILNWNNKYWEVDTIISNQLIGGKSGELNKPDSTDVRNKVSEFGRDWSYQLQAHMSRLSRINTEQYYYGSNDNQA